MKPSNKANKETHPILDDETLQLLVSTLESENVGEVKIDPSDIGSVMKYLLKAFLMAKSSLSSMEKQRTSRGEKAEGVANEWIKSKLEKLEERLRSQEDECDEIKQRSLKGNLILSSPDIPVKRIKSLIKSDQVLAEENKSVIDHTLDLIHTKYGVRVPQQDIQALHKLPNSTILIRVWNRREGSAWSKLINEIKTGGNRSVNVYLNFQLTQRRSNLVYQLRQFKKSSKIAKFFTDENGAISLKVKDKDAKMKITYYRKKDSTSPEKTFTSDELSRFVQSRK